MHRIMLVLTASAALGAAVAPAAAQSETHEPRETRSIFGGQPRSDDGRLYHQLDLFANLSGGYDDNVRPEGFVGPSFDARIDQSGYSGSGDAALRYWRGRSGGASFSLDGRGYTNAYPNLGVGAASGGGLDARVSLPVGRRSSLSVGQSVGTDPFMIFDSLALDPNALPGSEQTPQGLTKQRTWNASSTASLSYDVGRYDSLTFRYGYSQRRSVDEDRGDSRNHTASAAYSRTLGRSYGLGVSYSFADREVHDFQGLHRPSRSHTMRGGPRYSKRLSPTRQLSLSASAGAVHVRTVTGFEQRSVEYWAPSGEATALLDLGRSWTLGGSYNRRVAVLESVTRETFVVDTFNVSLGGSLTRRLDLSLNANRSTGIPRLTAERGRWDLDTTAASAQLRFALSRHAAFTTSYSYYHYDFSEDLSPGGFPPRFSRNAVRVGISLWAPLAGPRR